MTEAIKFAHEAIKVQCAAQERLAKAFGKKKFVNMSQNVQMKI